jgi:hypothetical protein
MISITSSAKKMPLVGMAYISKDKFIRTTPQQAAGYLEVFSLVFSRSKLRGI